MRKSIKSILRIPKSIVEKIFGIRILKKLPHGLDFIHDVRELPWPAEPNVIFDVGANIGQSAIPLSKAFPYATIQCFEPSAKNFTALLNATKNNNKIICHQIGISDLNGTASLILSEDNTMHHLSTSPSQSDHQEVINTVTLDDFYQSNKLAPHLDILKIDTEGHDLHVLRGAKNLLEDQSIGVVYCEVSMNQSNTFHASFEKINEFMLGNGYSLLGIYEQATEWSEKKPYLRRANVAFLSPALASKTI